MSSRLPLRFWMKKVNALIHELEQQEWADLYGEGSDPEAEFNACLVALVGDFYRANGGDIWGYDAGEGDYFTLDKYDGEYAVTEAGKRLCRKTKPQMVQSIQCTLRIFLAMIDIREEFDYIKSALDLLKDENMAVLKTIRDIQDAYDVAEAESNGFQRLYCPEVKTLDRLISTLPDRFWIE